MAMTVSIIIPVYNVAPYIEGCLESVMRQTYEGEMECIIVDDCGTDDSIAIAERMMAVYQGPILFRILQHEHNRGLSAARNTGTKAAAGDYIYYLDSDDEITEDCIEKLMAVALHDQGIEMVHGNGSVEFGNQGSGNPYIEQFPKSHLISNEDIRKFFYQKKIILICAWNKLIKKSFLTDHHLLFKEGIIYEDLLWLFYSIKYIRSVGFVSDITYLHRIRPGSITTGTEDKKCAYHRCIICQDIITHLTPGHEIEEYRYFGRFFASFYRRYAYCLPVFRETFPLYWRQAWQLKSYGMGGRLVVSYVLGKSELYAKVYEGLRKLKRWGASGIRLPRALSGTR